MKNTLYISVLLAGCTLQPKYERPTSPIPTQWNNKVTDITQTQLNTISWKKFFKSPQLQKIIEAALANNRDLRIAVLNVEAAQALYRIEKSHLLPNISANITGSKQHNVTTTSSLYQANIVPSFELDLFGRIRNQNTAALETYFATQEAQNAAQIVLIAETANAYLQWLADRKILNFTQQTLRSQEKAYELMLTSNKNGVASDLELAQALTLVESAKANEALYKRRVQQDKNAILLLIGNFANDTLSEDITLDGVLLMDKLPLNLPSAVLLNRPDIQQAEHQLKASNANIGAARAAFFPNISLTGTLGFASNSLSTLLSSSTSDAWSFTPQMKLPIFDGGANSANLDVAIIRKQIAVAQYEKSIQKAFREVADELAAHHTLKIQLRAQNDLVKASQKAYDLSNARYKLGVDSFLNSLDAQKSLYAAQENAIDVQKQYIANIVNLYKVFGGGVI